MTKLEKEAENLAIKEARNYKTVYSEDFRFDEVMKDPLRFDEDYPKTLYLLLKEKHYRDGYSDGFAEGRKEAVIKNLKENTSVMNTIIMGKLSEKCEQLAKENAELKEQLQNNPYVQILQNEKAEMLEDFVKQIEKMKCCGNCCYATNSNIDGTFCNRKAEYIQANITCKDWS